jgi:hypothetical protein
MSGRDGGIDSVLAQLAQPGDKRLELDLVRHLSSLS